MSRLARHAIRVVTAGLFAGLIAGFAIGPGWAPIPAGHGQLKISLAHRAPRREACRTLTEAERMALPPTRRVTEVCERGRTSSRLIVQVNERVAVDQTIAPAGLHGDGKAYYQEFITLPAGPTRLAVALRDEADESGSALQRTFAFELESGQAPLLAVGDGAIELRLPGSPNKDTEQ